MPKHLEVLPFALCPFAAAFLPPGKCHPERTPPQAALKEKLEKKEYMKQTKYRFLLPVVTLMVAVSLVGCAKEDPNPNNPDCMTIAPLASLGTSGVEAGSAHSSSAQTKAPVSGSDALNLYVARADQTSASAYGSYTTTAITAARTAGAGNQTLTLAPVQYYRADGLKTKLTGWYPAGTYNGTSHTVSWTIDGQQDVMTASKQEGDWTSGMPAMTFDHRLTQLQFYPYAETQATVDAWGKITRIEVLNQQNTVVYNLTNDDASGAVSFSGGATNSFSAGIAAGGASLSLSTAANKVTNVKQMGNPVMIVPQSAASHTLTLRIILADNTYKNVTLISKFEAGIPYRIYLRFVDLEMSITPEVAITDWTGQNINVEY